jgi:hypothetical protein
MALLDRGQATLVRRMKDSAGRDVVYTRTFQDPQSMPVPTRVSITLTAWIGNSLFSRTQSDPGAAVTWGDRDYLIAAADLVLANLSPLTMPPPALSDPMLTVPRIGDRIAEVIAGVPTTFEVMPTDNGEPPWRYSDQMRTTVRLHVKRVTA